MREFAATEQVRLGDTTDWQEPDKAPGERSGSRLTLAIGGSALLHGLLLGLLLTRNLGEPVPVRPDAIRIALLPSIPGPAVIEAPPVEEVTQEPLTSGPGERPLPPPQARPPEPPVQLPAVETLLLENGAIDAAPSLSTIRQTVQRVAESADAANWLYDCNPLEEEAGVRRCGQEPSVTAPVDPQRQAVYDSLNPVRRLTRTQRTIGTITAQSGVLAQNLEQLQVPAGMRDQMLEQLQATISLNSPNSPNATENLSRMANQSDAAQQAERILGDPWVQSRARELLQRRVTLDND